VSARARLGLIAALAALAALAGAPGAGARVLLVGKYRGMRGHFRSIQRAVDAAKPGDWILIGPGDYKARADHRAHRGPQPSDTPAGVIISTPRIHIRGMNRNKVIIDGTKPHSAPCSSKPSAQDFGPKDSDGSALGRNGIVVWKANSVWIQNLTACNFLGGSGSAGNEIWWNGGDGSGQIGGHHFLGSYLNATSTFFKDEDTAAEYGIFSSNWNEGTWNATYASNMNDSSYYIGACQQVCEQTMNHAWAQYSALGYSGTNAGGQLVVENSQFDHNKDGFDTNSQNNDDSPSPQDGACPNGGVSPITHTHSCWVFMNNYVHDNNNPNVPGAGVAGAGPVGTGVTITGGRNDTVMHNRFVNNGAWGILFLPYPDTETPPPGQNCQGGVSGPGGVCLYDDWGNALIGNTFTHNGFFGNPTNGDFGEITETPGHPINCYQGNVDTSGNLSSSPPGLQQTNSDCGKMATLPDSNADLTEQVACDSQFFQGTPCPPGSSYPQHGPGQPMPPLPTKQLKSMPHPCKGVPRNPWCRRHKHARHQHHHGKH
jgi:hypothetical protein